MVNIFNCNMVINSSNSDMEPLSHSGCRTSIFIFCLGVRSPWRIIAMTQRSSILKKAVDAKLYALNKNNERKTAVQVNDWVLQYIHGP